MTLPNQPVCHPATKFFSTVTGEKKCLPVLNNRFFASDATTPVAIYNQSFSFYKNIFEKLFVTHYIGSPIR
jgi:hypothetical protein